MSKTILYPFRINADFQIGYAWSAELSRRLRLRHALFTTLAPTSAEPLADVYHALAEAQGFYVRNFQLLHLGLKPVKSERNFMEGDYMTALQRFTREHPPHIIVMQSDSFSNETIKSTIDTGAKLIVLSTKELLISPVTRKDRAQLFLTILQSAALYNIPESFFKSISKDTGLFNYLAAYFKQ